MLEFYRISSPKLTNEVLLWRQYRLSLFQALGSWGRAKKAGKGKNEVETKARSP